MSQTMILKPRMSEKAYAISQTKTYVFDVPMDANKHSVARAVAAQFEVEVVSVNLLKLKGKAKRTIAQNGRRSIKGRDVAVKKAYVRVPKNAHIPIFDAMEAEQAQAEEQQQKLEKAMDKKSAKESKKAAKEAK